MKLNPIKSVNDNEYESGGHIKEEDNVEGNSEIKELSHGENEESFEDLDSVNKELED